MCGNGKGEKHYFSLYTTIAATEKMVAENLISNTSIDALLIKWFTLLSKLFSVIAVNVLTFIEFSSFWWLKLARNSANIPTSFSLYSTHTNDRSFLIHKFSKRRLCNNKWCQAPTHLHLHLKNCHMLHDSLWLFGGIM